MEATREVLRYGMSRKSYNNQQGESIRGQRHREDKANAQMRQDMLLSSIDSTDTDKTAKTRITIDIYA